MPIYEIKSDQLSRIPETSFGQAGIKEKSDLQRLLKSQFEIIAPDVLIIAEEFGEFNESKRRIDLLGIDKQANLVVIELKRTEDGGHMELQALRYAAMVSAMTFEQVVQIFSEYLEANALQKNAREEVLKFLEWEEPNEDLFAQDVRIILASAEFSKEITSTVLWLNTYGLDIRCVRLKPYLDNGRVLVYIEQVLPLPEATEYQIRVNSKSSQEKKARASTKDFSRHDVRVFGILKQNLAKRHAMFHAVKTLCDHGTDPLRIAELIHWRSARLFFVVDGEFSSGEFIQRASGQLGINGKNFDPNRWFCDDNELIIQHGKTYAFSNQWGFRTIEALKILQAHFPEAKIEFSKSQPTV